MTSLAAPSLVERVWWWAHAATWFPGWSLFQLLAVVLGALLVLREGGHRLVLPFVVGAGLAAAGAIALGSGAEWSAWLGHGARGPAPELEMAGFGAMAGLVVGHVLVARARGVAMARALDVLAPSVGVMVVVARAGCFFAGCDFGAPARLPWALRYPTMTPAFRAQADAGLIPAAAERTLAVHPTQLYEMGVGLLVVAAVFVFRSARGGERFARAIAVYAAGRFVVDLFRGDLAHGGMLGSTVTQGYAVALAGLVLAWYASAA